MSFITTESLAKVGINPDMISDDLDAPETLQGMIQLAVRRMRQWVGAAVYTDAESWPLDNPERIHFVMAELYLALCEVLPVIWMRQSFGARSVTIEGFRVDMAVTDPVQQQNVCSALLQKAEAALWDWIPVEGATAGVVLV
jgi:hypothetical protein